MEGLTLEDSKDNLILKIRLKNLEKDIEKYRCTSGYFNEYDLITFNALRWRMLNHEKYIPYIDEWQFSLSNESRSLLEDFIKKGGKMLAFHTSSICFDDWDGW